MNPQILAFFFFAATLGAQTPAAQTQAAQTQAAQTKAPPKPAPTANTQNSTQQDKDIENAIRAKLARSKIGKDGFTIRVQGGVAYWEGTTGVAQHKGSATRMAKTAGAKRVVNNIAVNNSSANNAKASDEAKPAAAGTLAQSPRSVAVKRAEPRAE